LIYFTSDLHLGHEYMIKSGERKFNSVNEMDQRIIRGWNSRVDSSDEVYIIGDFSAVQHRVSEYLHLLKGHKFLIRGEHDILPKDHGFENVCRYLEIKRSGCHFVLSHYPLPYWSKQHSGSIHLYGHLHAAHIPVNRLWLFNGYGVRHGINSYGCAINVGVEFFDYRPVSFDEILNIADDLAGISVLGTTVEIAGHAVAVT